MNININSTPYDIHRQHKGFHLFVYGTLKKGFHNHGFLEDEAYLGKATSAINLIMYERHGLPYVHLHKEKLGNKIKGEVYVVEDLSKIDRLEGVPYHYRPLMVPVVMDDDEFKTFVQCRCYIVSDYHPIDEENWIVEWGK